MNDNLPTRKPETAIDVFSADGSYRSWIADVKKRYHAMQIKAAVSVSSAVIAFYWELGHDIHEKYGDGKTYGKRFFPTLSADLRREMPGIGGFSTQNLRYCLQFYRLYSALPNFQQVVGDLNSIPWGHHVNILDKCRGNPDKALFYVRRTLQNGWSRNALLNWLSSDLYEREGRAQTNFALTLPPHDSDLARQLVKDPQIFEVFGLSEDHDERALKDAIVANIESALLSLGRGVAFLGREYPVEVGGETKRIDLLFYVVPLHRFLVVEVKTGKYEASDIGQLSGYMALARRVLNGTGDNPPIGLLVCKEHNRIFAQYHLEEIGVPIGITDYELRRVLPTGHQLTNRISGVHSGPFRNS